MADGMATADASTSQIYCSGLWKPISCLGKS